MANALRGKVTSTRLTVTKRGNLDGLLRTIAASLVRLPEIHGTRTVVLDWGKYHCYGYDSNCATKRLRKVWVLISCDVMLNCDSRVARCHCLLAPFASFHPKHVAHYWQRVAELYSEHTKSFDRAREEEASGHENSDR